MGFQAVHVLLSEEVGLEAHGVDPLPFPLVCLSFLTVTKKGRQPGVTPFSLSSRIYRATMARTAQGQTELSTAVDHWRLVERNLNVLYMLFFSIAVR
jgi:hypothetical protein